MESSLCEIRVYDPDFNWIGEVTQAESVQFTRDIFGAGGFEIHLHPDKTGALDLSRRGNIIMIGGDPHLTGVVRQMSVSEARGQAELVIYGDTGNGFAAQRITVPPTEAQVPGALGWDRVSGPAETVLKHYAAMHMATAYDANRNIPHLMIAADQKRGKVFPWQCRFSALAQELTNIGNYGGMGYETYADAAGKKWVFEVIPGTDRGFSNGKVSPVMFRVEYRNLYDYQYTEDYKNFRNTGYAGGAGEDEQRLLYTLGAGNAGYGRWETFLDYGGAESVSDLTVIGGQKLNTFAEAQNLNATLAPKTFVYGRDFFLGDTVSLYLYRLCLKADCRLTGVKEIWERPGGHTVQAVFGNRLPNFYTMFDRQATVR